MPRALQSVLVANTELGTKRNKHKRNPATANKRTANFITLLWYEKNAYVKKQLRFSIIQHLSERHNSLVFFASKKLNYSDIFALVVAATS
jgi:hypothetical protein